MEKQKVKAVLDYGNILSIPQKRLIYGFMSIPCIMICVSICIVISVSIGVMDWEKNIIRGLIAGNIVCLALFVCLIFILVRDSILCNKIKVWLLDSIEVDAVVEREDKNYDSSIPYQLSVSFILGTSQHKKLSSAKIFLRTRNKIFLKYDQCKIKILYSPKYDIVMFQN